MIWTDWFLLEQGKPTADFRDKLPWQLTGRQASIFYMQRCRQLANTDESNLVNMHPQSVSLQCECYHVSQDLVRMY